MNFKHYLLILSIIVTLTAIADDKRVMSLLETVQTSYVGASVNSPDGKFVAYLKVTPRVPYKDKDGKPFSTLHLTDKEGHSRPYITGKVNISKIQWSPDSQYIYYKAKRNDDKHIGLYRIAVGGGESTKVISHGSDISSFAINHDHSMIIFLAGEIKDKSVEKLAKKGFKAEVYEESKKNNETYRFDLTKPDVKAVKLDIDKHLLSIRGNPQDNTFLARVTDTPLIDDNYTSSQYVVLNKKGEIIKAFKTEGKLGKAYWSPDGKEVAIIGSENKNDPKEGRLYVANARSGKIRETIKNYQGHVRDLQWLKEYQLAYLGDKGTESEVGIINLDNGKVDIKVPAGSTVIRAIDGDSSGKFLTALASNSETPRELYDISSGSLKRLTTSNKNMQQFLFPRQESISYQARDGLELGGVLVYPTDYKKGKRYPLIMMVHGGPESNVRNEWNDRYSYPVKYATGNGFAVFLPNYRGSTGRGVEFSKKGQADYAGGEFNDLVDAITHLHKIGLVDKKRVGITGGSYGGYASAWAATALSEHFAASVMFVGITDQLSKFGTTDIPREMHDVHSQYYPWERWQWMLERSPIYHTDKAKTPLLIMHGKDDTRVHPSQSMELYRYIKLRTKTPVRLVFYPGEGHGNKKVAGQLDYSMRLMRWMEFYLKGDKKTDQIPPYEINHKDNLRKAF